MKRFSLSALPAALAPHFELFLTICGVLFAIVAVAGELTRGEQTAIVFIIWLQGLIVWAVHRHAWFQRRALIHKLRSAVDDLVNDRLAAMVKAAELSTREIHAEAREPARFVAVLDNLSTEVESLRAWEQQLQLLRT
jgi:hypothetical protein